MGKRKVRERESGKKKRERGKKSNREGEERKRGGERKEKKRVIGEAREEKNDENV